MLLSSMVTRVSPHTQAPPSPRFHLRATLNPGQGTGHLLRHSGESASTPGHQRGGQESLCSFWELCCPWGCTPDCAGRKS